MTYVALAFVVAFTSLFIWQTATALRTGVFNGLGWSARRESAPHLWWLLLIPSVICIAAGLFVLVILLSIIADPAGS